MNPILVGRAHTAPHERNVLLRHSAYGDADGCERRRNVEGIVASFDTGHGSSMVSIAEAGRIFGAASAGRMARADWPIACCARSAVIP